MQPNTFTQAMQRIVGIILLMLFTQHLVAQVVEPVRMELSARIDVPAYQTVLFGEKGMMVYYESTETDEQGKRKWYFTKLDTNLREQWVQYVPITDGLVRYEAFSDSTGSVMIFSNAESRRSGPVVYEVLIFNELTSSFQLVGGQLPEKSGIRSVGVSGYRLLLGINLPRFESDLLLFDLTDGSMQSVAHGIAGQSVIQAIEGGDKSGSFFVALKRFENNRMAEDVFLTIGSKGETLGRWSYVADGIYLHSMTLQAGEDGSLVIAGSFDNDRRRTTARAAANANELNFEAKGVFFMRFSLGEPVVASFRSFESFSNIYRALSTDDLIRNRNRITRGRMIGPEPQITFQFYKPRLLAFEGQWIFSAEAFKPQYRFETRMDYDFYGRLVPFTYSVFEGFQFFSTILLSFDNNGNMLWSSDFETRNILLPSLRSSVALIADTNNLVLAYVQNGLLNSKVVGADGSQIGQTEQVKIESTYTNDRLLEENFGAFYHWYGPYYVATANQRISNNRLRTNNPRSIFFIQKIVFE